EEPVGQDHHEVDGAVDGVSRSGSGVDDLVRIEAAVAEVERVARAAEDHEPGPGVAARAAALDLDDVAGVEADEGAALHAEGRDDEPSAVPGLVERQDLAVRERRLRM